MILLNPAGADMKILFAVLIAALLSTAAIGWITGHEEATTLRAIHYRTDPNLDLSAQRRMPSPAAVMPQEDRR